MPRYTRDEIIQQGLELAMCSTVTAHDITGDVIADNAFSIKWLQNALDMFHTRYPFSADVLSVPMTLASNSTDMYVTSIGPSQSLPDNYIIDVRNGITFNVGNQKFRAVRKSFQYWLDIFNRYQSSQSLSIQLVYTKVANKFKVAPPLVTGITADLWYYALPSQLAAGDYPSFPDEWTLVEFIRLKALEWTRSLDPGTAQAYMTKELARLRSSGLLDSTEYDIVPLENNQVLIDSALINRNAWMGGIAL